MKEVKAISAKSGNLNRTDIMAAVIYHIVSALLGFIICRTVFAEEYIPFGVSFAAGCPLEYLPSAAAGIIIGYFIPTVSASGFRYVAAALAVLAIRFMTSFSKKLSKNHFFAALLALICIRVTSTAAYGGIRTDILFLTLEALVCCAGAFVISRISGFLPRFFDGLTSEELGLFLVGISMALAGLYKINIFSVSLSAVLGVALILCALKFGGALSGTIAATAVSLFLFFAGRSVQLCFIYTVAAMISGLTLSYGKYAELCTFLICFVTFSLMQSSVSALAPFITEVLIGCIIFAFLPRSAGVNMSRIFTCFPQISVNNDLNRAVNMRLKEAAAGLKDVKVTIDEVAARLDGINAPSFSGLLEATKAEACSGCKMHALCWEARKDSTVDFMFSIIKHIKKFGTVEERHLPEEFKNRCLSPERFSNAINETYKKYSSAAAANNRIGQIRRAVCDQFEGMASMLSELSADFSSRSAFDNQAALTAVTALKNIGIPADECSAPVDKYGRMKISLKLKKPSDAVLNKRDIMKVLSLACERDFAPPVIKKISGETFINISERAKLRVDFGASQKSANTGDMCGDAYTVFPDGQGHFIMLLSDGMGTGGRAAVDATLASGLMGRLLKSGFGYNCALKILNSSMLFKSADESLATMDIASIDLFTGNTELYKAGAAPTIVRKGGKTGQAVSTSMPVGILSDVEFDRAGVKLRQGDILVLFSDGAAFDGTDWIRDELSRFSSGTAQDLADRLCICAESRRKDGHADDITVLAAIINNIE